MTNLSESNNLKFFLNNEIAAIEEEEGRIVEKL
jgi:hypothetical protein